MSRPYYQRKLSLAFFLILVLGGCGTENFSERSARIIIDGSGSRVEIPAGAKKVIGLSPAMTEILFSILPDSQILAVTKLCNYPPEKVSSKPRIEVYPLDLESILKLHPDVIFSEVGMTSPQDAAHLRQLGIPVVLFSYTKTRDILAAMDSVRSWIPCLPDAGETIASLKKELDVQEKKYKHRAIGERPSILSITWHDPIFAYGYETWMTDKMWLAGGKNCLEKKLDKPYPVLQQETVLKLNPDVLFGGSFEKMDSSFFRLYPQLRQIKAYKTRQVYELNDDLASRPGPRFILGIREIENHLSRK
jgi:iron complex transport system substrate-binding protein